MPNSTYGRSQGKNMRRRSRTPFVTKRYLKQVIGTPETKWYNYTYASTAVTNAGQIVDLSGGITQGVGVSQRVGNEITNKSMHMRLDLTRAAVDSFVRIIIFWYLDGNLTPPIVGNVLQTASYQSPLNKDFGKSVWVKFDKTYTLAAGQTQLQVDEIWRKLKCKTEFNSGTTFTNNNNLYLLAISNQSVLANQPLLSFTNRLTYLDV